MSTAVLTEFAVSDVVPTTTPLAEVPYPQAVREFLRMPFESCSSYHGRLVSEVRSQPLLATLHAAFTRHHPVVLSPDAIWLTLTQGLAQHIRQNAEELRSLFVSHAGQLTIKVRRDDFVKGSPENPWPEVFNAFTEQIRAHIGPRYDLIVANFSTTGPVERAASAIILLDAMQHYFKLELHTRCGIPSIQLLGTIADWQAIANRVEAWRELGLSWWVDALQPVLAQFVSAASGEVNREFWDSIYKWQGPRGSGDPWITGWVADLFPYLVRYGGGGVDRNPYLGISSQQKQLERDSFPSQPARAPFEWHYLGHQFPMCFVGGLIGVRQDPQNFALRPEIGWVVAEANEVPQGSPDMEDLQGWFTRL